MILRGQRIKLTRTNDPDLRPGMTGTVAGATKTLMGHAVIDVDWDNGKDISILPAFGDGFEVLVSLDAPK